MRVGIIGTGLIGGSLAYALKRSNRYEVSCFNRKTEVSIKAKEQNAVDEYFLNMQELTDKNDIIILGTTLSSYKDIVSDISHQLKGKILTDIGSVKEQPSLEIFDILTELSEIFVPAHPIAGKETSGFDSASADLFVNKKLIITPFDNTRKDNIDEVSRMWIAAGSNVEILPPSIHDEIYASVSHFVQMISFATKNFIKPNDLTKEFCRLQNSPATMWDEIFLYNNKGILKTFNIFDEKFRQLKTLKNDLINDHSIATENELSAYLISKMINDMTVAEYKKYAGSGFKSITKLSTEFNSLKATLKVVEESFVIIEKILDEIKNSYLPGNV